ncbi:MAG TPA: beta-galactosidase [Clostridia bacterium]|nr:beta-galactosidase [Clostridia bacterium]
MINDKLPYIYYGGDYNPDQWPEEIWQDDMRLFKKSGINVVTLPVFSWAKLQPSEDVYEFGWLDRVMELLDGHGIKVCMATSTAAQPGWMSKKYPEILPVDFNGIRHKHGGRVNFCPNNAKFREFSARLAGKLAERYKKHNALLLWHIGNEYGNYCYCDDCTSAFQKWAKKRYGTIEEVNRRWNMSFWGHTLYDWDEIVAPSGISGMWIDGGRERACFQGIALDYKRFMSESILDCYRNEYNSIRKAGSKLPITTNLMGTFKPLDYFKWAEAMDVVSWDNYPTLTEPVNVTAMKHDLMRGLKGGLPFMLMEQTPSQQNWAPYNSLKRPGVMRLWSYQAVAHGADTVMFFQMRRSIGACEKYHGAVIAHAGHEDTRVFKECAQLGAELKKLGDRILDSRIDAKAAIVFDWENWWAVELSSGPSIDLKYVDQVNKYYKAFHDMNIAVDFIKPESNFEKYDVVVAPVMYMVKPGVADSIERFVKCGGTFVTTFFSGIVNENDLVTLGGYPGDLKSVLGIWVEEIDALFPDMKNSIVMNRPFGKLTGCYECGLLCDLLHLKGAEALGAYEKDFYAGMPAITVNKYGKGKAYYVATDPEEVFIKDFIAEVCKEKGIIAPFDSADGVEITQRNKGGIEFTFILNHNSQAASIDLKGKKYKNLLNDYIIEGKLKLEPKDVAVLEIIK